jgi:hypothetical protein
VILAMNAGNGCTEHLSGKMPASAEPFPASLIVF